MPPVRHQTFWSEITPYRHRERYDPLGIPFHTGHTGHPLPEGAKLTAYLQDKSNIGMVDDFYGRLPRTDEDTYVASFWTHAGTYREVVRPWLIAFGCEHNLWMVISVYEKLHVKPSGGYKLRVVELEYQNVASNTSWWKITVEIRHNKNKEESGSIWFRERRGRRVRYADAGKPLFL